MPERKISNPDAPITVKVPQRLSSKCGTGLSWLYPYANSALSWPLSKHLPFVDTFTLCFHNFLNWTLWTHTHVHRFCNRTHWKLRILNQHWEKQMLIICYRKCMSKFKVSSVLICKEYQTKQRKVSKEGLFHLAGVSLKGFMNCCKQNTFFPLTLKIISIAFPRISYCYL